MQGLHHAGKFSRWDVSLRALSHCPRISPSLWNGSTQTCTSELAGASPHWSMFLAQGQEGLQDMVYSGTADPTPFEAQSAQPSAPSHPPPALLHPPHSPLILTLPPCCSAQYLRSPAGATGHPAYKDGRKWMIQFYMKQINVLLTSVVGWRTVVADLGCRAPRICHLLTPYQPPLMQAASTHFMAGLALSGIV